MKTLFTLVLTLVMLNGCGQKMNYPQTKKINQTDDYHGTSVADPYRWLENDTASDTRVWVEAENKVTFDFLKKIPFRDQIKKRLEEIWDYPKYSAPFKKGDYYFFYKNDGLQNQATLYFQKGLKSEPKVFIDPNSLSKDGTVALSGVFFSRDHKLCAYMVAESGSDWNRIYVLDVETQKKLTDEIRWVKFSGANWRGNGFYYSRYDEPIAGTELSKQNEFQKVYYHEIGKPQSADVLIYEDKQHARRGFGAGTTEDERFLVVTAWEGTSGNEVYVKDLKNPKSEFQMLCKGFDHNYDVIDNLGDELVVLTDKGAPKYHLVAINPKNPDVNNWKQIIPEKKELLEKISLVGNKFFASYLKDASTKIHEYDLAGKFEREIDLPAIGTATGFGGERKDKEAFYTFTSFTYPPMIYRYDIAASKSELFIKTKVNIDLDAYETKQVFYASQDGTKIPMFIVHKKGIPLDGNNPANLYGYGGFNISLTPAFSPSRMILLEQGGVLAIPNLRGGGEYGEDWHKAGMLDKKQNVFDDFIAAAEYLIANKYTSNQKLSISGGSNGGLLVGAAMTQRPDLFKVAFPAVGVLDMLRYHKFTIGHAWAVEYGSSDSALHFKNLIQYSPLHNLREGVNYPATLITTADHDDRVVPAHSFKFAATLQEKYRGPNPVMIRIDSKAGHGAGKPTSKILEEAADVYSFMFYNMGFAPKTFDAKPKM